MASKRIGNITVRGNMGGDPDFKKTRSGELAQFSVAVWAGWEDRNARTNRVVWFNVVCFDPVICEGFTKGNKVVVSGNLRLNRWTGRDGVEHESLGIFADSVALQDGQQPQTAPAVPLDIDDDIPF